MSGGRSMRSRIMGALLVLAVAMCAAAADEQPKNLIENPGFEIAVAGKDQPKDWGVAVWSDAKNKTGKAVVELTDDARTGKKAAKVRYFEGSRNIVLIPKLTEPVTGAGRLRLAFYVKVPRGLSSYSSINMVDAKGKKLAYLIGKGTTPSVAWQEVLFEFDTPADTANITVYLRANGDGVLFDDVRLEAAPDEQRK